jgi:hypothetical protein
VGRLDNRRREIVSMQHALVVGTSGSTCVLVSVALLLGSVIAAAGPPEATQRAGAAGGCTARSTAAGLDVACPSATMAELVSVLQQATGLRSEYPKELALVPVSVMLRRASLLTVLENVLAGFNFAVWTDENSPSVMWLRILEARRAVVGARPPPVEQQRSPPSIETTPASTTTLSANNETQMAEVPDGRADSVTSTLEVEPIPVVTSPVVMPDVDVPR